MWNKKAGMESCKSSPTPSKPHTQLLISEGTPLADPSYYISILGTLQYLTFIRPDIAYLVNIVCQFMNRPTDAHLFLVKRILRYLLECGLTYTPYVTQIHGYSDADWATDINTRHSITNYIVFIGDNPISWQSKKQPSVSRSSTEAEYKALANCTADVCWIRNILRDVHENLDTPPSLHCDNISALALSTNHVFHLRIKHMIRIITLFEKECKRRM